MDTRWTSEEMRDALVSILSSFALGDEPDENAYDVATGIKEITLDEGSSTTLVVHSTDATFRISITRD